MNIDEGIAEFYGALLGDGCLSKYFTACDQRTRYCVQLTGHVHDREYYETVLQPTILRAFGVHGTIRLRNGTRAIIFDILQKDVFSFFHSLGMPIGKKGELFIPPCIAQNDTGVRACIRGIFNTDGSIYQRYSRKYVGHTRVYPYLVVQFKMNTKTLLAQLRQIFVREGMTTNRIIRDKNAYVLRITQQKSIHQFMAWIQTPHKHHRERYLKSAEESVTTVGP